jgi:hypothetical protein
MSKPFLCILGFHWRTPRFWRPNLGWVRYCQRCRQLIPASCPDGMDTEPVSISDMPSHFRTPDAGRR